MLTGTPRLTTVIEPTILVLNHDGHKVDHHGTMPDFTTFIVLVIKQTQKAKTTVVT